MMIITEMIITTRVIAEQIVTEIGGVIMVRRIVTSTGTRMVVIIINAQILKDDLLRNLHYLKKNSLVMKNTREQH